MPSNNQLKKKVQASRLKKNNSKAVKDVLTKNMTHTQFISFIEPFYELVKEKNLEELKKQMLPKTFNLKKELYYKLNEQFKERLCCGFLFNEDIEINSNQTYNNKLVMKKPIKTPNIFYTIFEKHDVLKKYESSDYKSLIAEYQNRVRINNERRHLIYDLVKDRMLYQCYTHAYDLVHNELDNLTKRNKTRKNSICGSVDMAVVKEYLQRIDEFNDLFGTFDQFTDDQMDYDDVFRESSDTNNGLYFV